jgi:riboflavin biosynthesis pyrimidine reductase
VRVLGVEASEAALPPGAFRTLVEDAGSDRFDLPAAIGEIYGGFGLPAPVVYANFVASLDGIVAVPDVPRSSALISGGAPADRFVMALLRACADAVVIGAGTLRSHDGPWTAANAYPDAADAFAELRRRLGLAPEPILVVVTGSGELEEQTDKLRRAIIVTTEESEEQATRLVGAETEIVAAGRDGRVDVREVVSLLSDRGHARILTEGGPTLMGRMLEAGVVDELFLTMSPVLAGGGEEPRPTLAAGVDLLPAGVQGRLLGIRGHGSYLFLRYALPRDRSRADRNQD